MRINVAILSTWALILAYLVGAARGHNANKMAYTIPLEGITIDGKLDDWPDTMAVYPIDVATPFYKPTPPEGPEDLSASFRVGYDEEQGVLYVAVVVRDEELVVRRPEDLWQLKDACEIYIDGDHSGSDDATRAAAGAQQYVMVPGASRFRADLDANPALIGGKTAESGVQAVFLRLGYFTVYEWAIPLFERYPDRRLTVKSGQTIGFDVVAVDADGEEDANWVAWTPEGGKVWDSNRFGDLTFVEDYGGLEVTLEPVASSALLESYADLGLISGRVTHPHDGSPWVGVAVRVEDQQEKPWAEATTDADGRYQVWVPAGSYRIFVADAKGVDPVDVTLKAGEQVEDIDFAPTAVGPTIPIWPFTTGLGVLGIGILAGVIPLARRREGLGGILLSPASTLQEVAGQPDWVGPFFLVLVSALVVSVTVIGNMLTEMGGSLGGMPGSTQIVTMIVMPLLTTVAILIFSYGAWLVRAGLIWILARISGERARFYPLLSVVGYAYLPEMLLGGIVMACVVSFGVAESSGPWSAMPTSLVGLFPNLAVANAPLRTLLGAIELFGFWSLVITIMGIQRVYEFRTSKAAVIVILYWLLAVGAIVGFVAIVNALQQMMAGG